MEFSDLTSPHPVKCSSTNSYSPWRSPSKRWHRNWGEPANRISEIVLGRHAVSADADLRLACFFGLSEGFWLHFHNAYDVMEAKRAAGKIDFANQAA